MGNGRRFGIELEFDNEWEYIKKHASKIIKKIYGPRRYIARNDGFDSDFALNKWHIKVDGNTHAEITSPVSKFKDIEKILTVIDYISDQSVNCGEDDGFHIHIDVGDIDKYHLLSGWLRCEKTIYKMFPKERKDNAHCEKLAHRSGKIISTSIEDIMEESENHSAVLSCQRYDERKTVEFRIAESTTDIKFIRAWIIFIIKFIDSVKKINPTIIGKYKTNHLGWAGLMGEVELEERIQKVLKKRYNKYKSEK